MSADFPFTSKIVSPAKCNEKPWDLWISEIGHSSPLPDDDGAFAAPAEKSGASRRVHDTHPYKVSGRGHARYRHSGLNRLKHDTMSLHGLFPQMDNLNAAICHMCGLIVKCSAANRHLESHNGSEPILPPPPPAPTVKLKLSSRSRHKKEAPPPPPPVEIPVKMETSLLHPAPAPLSRIVLPDLQYLDDASTAAAVTGEVQVCVESGELPVVSIQDTEELPLGDNITDDIFDIMNSEGIQSADDITNAADWKNIIRDIGNMQEINFPQTTDQMQTSDLYPPVDTSSISATYTLNDSDLANIQFAPNTTTPILPNPMETASLNTQVLKPVTVAPTTPMTKSQSRSKSSKTKFNLREYDPNKHCGVITADNPKPCTRSLTCKAHALSLRRLVEGRVKSFDTLLAEHRASRDPNTAAGAVNTPITPGTLHMTASPVTTPTATMPHNMPSLLVSTSMTKDLTSFINGLTAEQQVNDIYASLLSVEDPNSLFTQPLPADLLLPDDAEIPVEVPIEPLVEVAPVARIEELPDDGPPPLVPTDVCWYSSCPRPLALCTFNASHGGGAITIGKKFATVRSNIKSSLTRSQCKSTGSSNNYYYNQNALSLSKSVHMSNSSKTSKPEVRKLIVTCSATSGANRIQHEMQQTLSDLFSTSTTGEMRHTLNGHLSHGDHKRSNTLKHKRPSTSVLDLGFSLDPLLADEKC